MENKFFNTLSENKSLFDQKPTTDLWSRIDSNLNNDQKSSKIYKLRYILSIAASLLVLVIAQLTYSNNQEELDFYGNIESTTFENILTEVEHSKTTVVTFNKVHNIHERYSKLN